jgi:hypothetical protein
MKNLFILLLVTFLFDLQSLAQTKNRKVYYFFSIQGDKTLYDFAKEKNPGGVGLGLQLNFRPTKVIQPLIELNADAIGKGNKDLYFLSMELRNTKLKPLFQVFLLVHL